MPSPDIASVLLHEASALESSREAISLTWIQPYGNLVYTDILGPHFPEDDRLTANRRALAFVNLAKENGAEIAIAPEYFTPIEALKTIFEDRSLLRIGTLYILPLECITLIEYEKLKVLASGHGADLTSSILEPSNGKTFVNPCAILFKSQDGLKVFLQTKISPSRVEEAKMVRGQNIFAIEGKHMVLVVLICSDANPPEYYQTWADAAAYKSGAYVIHTQWNPRPDYPQYDHLWSALLDVEDGPKRVVFSINWAPNSALIFNHQRVREIRCSRNRIFRGKTLQKDSYYPECSAAGLHVSHNSRGYGYWEIWHSMPPNEHVYFVKIFRPFEAVPVPQGSHNIGILKSDYFESVAADGHFEKRLPEGLGRPFWETCERFGLDPGTHVTLDELPLSDIERLINACLLRSNRSWMNEDVSCRVPTAPLLCNRADCTELELQCFHSRSDWERDTQHVTDCLQEFQKPEVQRNGLSVKPTKLYPLNLTNATDKEAGWLFHGQGFSNEYLEKTIHLLLKEEGLLDNFRGPITLFSVGARGDIRSDKIFDHPGSVATIDTGSQEISNDSHGPEINVVNL